MGPLCLGPPAPVITGIAVGLAAGELLPRWLRAVDWAVAALPCSRVPSTFAPIRTRCFLSDVDDTGSASFAVPLP